jgi:hypothetical protein
VSNFYSEPLAGRIYILPVLGIKVINMMMIVDENILKFLCGRREQFLHCHLPEKEDQQSDLFVRFPAPSTWEQVFLTVLFLLIKYLKESFSLIIASFNQLAPQLELWEYASNIAVAGPSIQSPRSILGLQFMFWWPP